MNHAEIAPPPLLPELPDVDGAVLAVTVRLALFDVVFPIWLETTTA